jgi:hypothetical protein
LEQEVLFLDRIPTTHPITTPTTVAATSPEAGPISPAIAEGERQIGLLVGARRFWQAQALSELTSGGKAGKIMR